MAYIFISVTIPPNGIGSFERDLTKRKISAIHRRIERELPAPADTEIFVPPEPELNLTVSNKAAMPDTIPHINVSGFAKNPLSIRMF
jgi:hypothetical protein